jgi:death on curing protein
MRYLTLHEVLEAHERILQQSGGEPGVLNVGALESALAQPRMTFGGQHLYPTIVEKAAALGFSLIQNHPFVEQEDMILQVAAGKSGREVFTEWLHQHLQAMP